MDIPISDQHLLRISTAWRFRCMLGWERLSFLFDGPALDALIDYDVTVPRLICDDANHLLVQMN